YEDPRRRRAGRPADRSSAMSEDPRGSFEGKHEFTVIGQPLPKIDAWAKVIGETKYADDLFLPRMAYGRLLRSPHGHARVGRVDTTRARALPGVYRSEEHTSELQSRENLVCRLLLEKK